MGKLESLPWNFSLLPHCMSQKSEFVEELRSQKTVFKGTVTNRKGQVGSGGNFLPKKRVSRNLVSHRSRLCRNQEISPHFESLNGEKSSFEEILADLFNFPPQNAGASSHEGKHM